MTAAEIQRLCQFIPNDDDNVLVDHYRRTNDFVNRDLGLDDADLARFLRNYKDMGFGWNFARTLARNGLDFPPAATSTDDWLWRAYLYNRNKAKYRDETIMRTLAYITPGSRMQKSIMHALLANEHITPKVVAEAMNIPVEVIQAYQHLFFDIEGRRDDFAFIAALVYPHGRVVEFYADYIHTEALENLLLRAGYNNGVEDVLYFAGMRNTLVMKHANLETIAKLEAMFMSNGYILARNGWLNGNGPGLGHARALMAAAKQGGQDQRESPLTPQYGSEIYQEVVTFQRHQFTRHRRDLERKEAEAKVTEVIPGK